MKDAFLELKQEMTDREQDFRYSKTKQLINEKKSLQDTVKAMTDEVEQLSIMNERFLSDLKKNDYYIQYAASQEELYRLRNAHILLINDMHLESRHGRRASSNSIASKSNQDLLNQTSQLYASTSKPRLNTSIDQPNKINEISQSQQKRSIASFLTCGAYNKEDEDRSQLIGYNNDSDGYRINAEFLHEKIGDGQVDFLHASQLKVSPSR